MKFLVFFALALATVWAKDLYLRSNKIPVIEKEDRIFKGQNAGPGQFPYQVGINNKRVDSFYWCSGSLIAKDWVLTSAVCISGALWSRLYLGATERLVAEEFYTVYTADMIVHPRWNPHTFRNDLGLIRIPVTNETGTIGIVRIPRDDFGKYVGKRAVIAGWGQTSDKYQSVSNDLKYVTLTVTNHADCSFFRNYYDSDVDMCVSTSDLRSPCHGDEGGPLVLKQESLQIGLFTYNSRSGCELGIPVVFVRLGAYADWIWAHFYE